MLVTLSVFIGIEGASVYSARTGAIATLYGPWPVYAAGLSYLLMCAVLFVPGIFVHIGLAGGRTSVTPVEIVIAAAILALGIFAGWAMWTGRISPL